MRPCRPTQTICFTCISKTMLRGPLTMATIIRRAAVSRAVPMTITPRNTTPALHSWRVWRRRRERMACIQLRQVIMESVIIVVQFWRTIRCRRQGECVIFYLFLCSVRWSRWSRVMIYSSVDFLLFRGVMLLEFRNDTNEGQLKFADNGNILLSALHINNISIALLLILSASWRRSQRSHLTCS